MIEFLGLIGLTLIIVRGEIFGPLQRWWPSFFRCARCVGMWVGIAAGASTIVPAGHGRVIDAFLVGGAVSFLALTAEGVHIWLLGEPDETKPSCDT